MRESAHTPAPVVRPVKPPFHARAVPEQLRRLDRWVCWGYLWSERKQKWDKPPRRRDGRFASSTDASTWCSFTSAASAVGARSEFDGVGLVLVGDGLCAIDLDHCIGEGETNLVRDGNLEGVECWARTIIEELASYTEISPSGRGIRIFIRASLPKGSGNRRGSFEVYDASRYVTVTGDRVHALPPMIARDQSALDRVLHQMLSPLREIGRRPRVEVVDVGDEELIGQIRRSRLGARFCALFDRAELSDFGGDHSRADFALCTMLAPWCGFDGERVHRLFRRSALFRSKWDERHSSSGETYGEMTIGKVLRRG